MNIENFIPKYLWEIRNFCVEDLAGILYSCVEHDEPRENFDWVSAEAWIDKNPVGTLIDLTRKFLFLTGYQKLSEDGFSLPKIEKDCFSFISSDEVKRVANKLSILKDEKFSDLVDRLGREERRKYQKEFIGRDIWDEFYQRMKYDSYLNTVNNFLKSRGYTKIIFG